MKYHILAFALATIIVDPVVEVQRVAARPPAEEGTRPGTRMSASFHTCAVRQDGTIQCWGLNGNGQLGNGDQTNQPAPVAVRGVNNAAVLSNIVSVSSGNGHTCALNAGGTVHCWGANGNGQLGIGTSGSNQLSPVQVRGVNNVGFLTDVVAVSAGAFHTCALLSDSTVQCWGFNNSGRLGNGDQTGADQASPVPVRGVNNVGILANVVALSAGGAHTCALLSDGTVRCWGANSNGQLGIGTSSAAQFTPVVVIKDNAPLTGVVALESGNSHTCGVMAEGTVHCWGDNLFGQIGDGTRFDRTSPTLVTGLSNVVWVVAGNSHTCAALADGTARCWGENSGGRLGNGDEIDQLSPVAVKGINNVGVLSNIAGISAGEFHSCALSVNDSIHCWGADGGGQLGNGAPLQNSPTPVVTASAGSISGRGIAAGTQHSCARRASSTGACWGNNATGELGNATNDDSLVPSTVKTLRFSQTSFSFEPVDLTGFKGLSAGRSYTCEVGGNGTVRCWGVNENGKLGNGGTTGSNFAPIAGISGLSNVVAVAASAFHSCALLATGTVECWGRNVFGAVGDGTTTERHEPVGVHGENNVGVLSNVKQIAIGTDHSCALLSNGTVRCWGDNDFGQIGSTGSSTTPVVVTGDLGNVVAIAAGSFYNCALLSNGKVRCWGSNRNGQLGNGTRNTSTAPVFVQQLGPGGQDLVDLDRVVAIGAGFEHTCALRTNGIVVCWGDNNQGQLGTGGTADSPIASPTPVQRIASEGLITLSGIVGLGVGLFHTCALRVNGQPFCWGSNTQGQLGDGSTNSRPAALPVPSFTLNIDPLVELHGKKREVTLNIIATCEEGDRLQVRVELTQGSASGHGNEHFDCTGALEKFPVRVHAEGPNTFLEGAAQAEAEAEIRGDQGEREEQEWAREVEIVSVP